MPSAYPAGMSASASNRTKPAKMEAMQSNGKPTELLGQLTEMLTSGDVDKDNQEIA
ncbi:MAG TPA: hypothetical protein PKN89_00435 [Anaerolineaceae bacterium]|nr:hypothetical protein [Anaerolineaceae bacterium]